MMANEQPGRRIAVIGTSGSGKTYVAEALAARLGIPYVSNDAIIWRPGWQLVPHEDRIDAFDAATRGDAWTFDGNLYVKNEDDRIVLARCDTIVWLDLPRWQVWSQVTWRTLRGLITKQPHWQGGNAERWSIFFSPENIIWHAVKTFARRRRDYRALFADPAFAGRTLIRLNSRRVVTEWLEQVRAAA